MIKQIFLHEWEWQMLPAEVNPKELQVYLSELWKNRHLFYEEDTFFQTDEEESDLNRFKQGFLRFDNNYISARNYVGFIQFNGIGINILPKIYSDKFSSSNIQLVTLDLLHWLKHSKRIRFPFSEVNYEKQHFEHFLEIFIFIFSEYTSRQIEKKPFQRFEELTESTLFIKGKFAVNEYIKESIITGYFHRIISTFESFRFNNLFNQIIKNVATKLLKNTLNNYSRQKLQHILFMLDEVDDVSCTEADCNKIYLSPIYSELNVVLNMCRMFLSGQSIKRQDNSNSNFCFLVPMEVVFEEYVVGILENNSKSTVLRQPSFKYLTEEGLFELRPDIIYNNSIIIDTKYKLIDDYSDNKKMGISQSDLYQMLAYSIRYKIKKIILLYPLLVSDSELSPIIIKGNFTITDEINNSSLIICIKQIDMRTRDEESIERLMYDF